MSAQDWTVDVDGVKHSITVESDATTGRTSVRVDGRMTSRPLGPDEEEREFRVGSRVYLLRRMADGTFDLDIAPGDQATLAAAAYGPAVTQRKQRAAPRSGSQKLVIAVVMIAVAAGLGWWAWDSTAYMRVPWQPFAAPGGTVSIDFPEAPVDVTRDVVVEGEKQQVASFTARYRDHEYALEHYDIGEPLYEHLALKDLTEKVRFAWGSAIKETTETMRSGREAIAYVADLPAAGEDGPVTLRGIMTVHQNRIYMAWVETPQGESETTDVNHFLRSIKLPDEYAYHRNSYRPSLQDRMANLGRRSAHQQEATATLRLMSVVIRLIGAVAALVLGIFLLRSGAR